MILQALVKEYENLAQKGLVSKPGWSQAKVSYAIDLNADGSIKVIYSLQTEDQRGKKIVITSMPCSHSCSMPSTNALCVASTLKYGVWHTLRPKPSNWLEPLRYGTNRCANLPRFNYVTRNAKTIQ